jgi:hypothetical protein
MPNNKNNIAEIGMGVEKKLLVRKSCVAARGGAIKCFFEDHGRLYMRENLED